ncbi:serine/threonine-protein kinase [Haloferula sp. BvORR071]|uniref:serine/threonine-protein kinase n=1 Tax=Haloferula sp. BvORR071 TaxID=1396141 RepID=UPI0006966C62|nr:serine/threonine-protein kinase [Haloferula sp. BvORR071]
MNLPADAIFSRALELEDPERADYLKSACGGDAELRLQVERMLVEYRKADAYFAEADGATLGAEDFNAENFKERYAEKEGDVIGPYKLRQLIGQGGFGVVWMAEQLAPISRMVALKVIKAGMDTRQVLARFEAERQALAMMDHPNIARVLDTGSTASGRPYFAMELVKGIPITDYCDGCNLGTRERLTLFSDVCSAINHAHQKGVIHRDIKPSNVMVTLHGDKAVAKVIDFGIAKATQGKLTDKTLFTRFEQIIGTPTYMSPEQAALSGLDIDTRSDIYALGILLYELLTGKPPFDAKSLLSAGYEEMRRIIREVEPPKPSLRLSSVAGEERVALARSHHIDPSKLSRLVEPDLDWIVMKSIEKDRTRRYETANALAMDIRRFLTGEPVSASPPSAAYRFKKFVKRNKLAFGTASAVVAALVLGLGVSLWQAVEKTRAYQRAEASERKSREVATFLKDMLNGVGPAVALGKDTTLLKEILDKTAERIATDLKGQPEVEMELRTTLGDVYRAIAEQRTAELMYRRALELSLSAYGDDDERVATAKNNLALVLSEKADYPESEKLFLEAIATYKKAGRNSSEDLAGALNNLGVVYRDNSRLEEAEAVQRESLEIVRKLHGDDHVKTGYCEINLSIILVRDRKLEGAESYARSAVDLFRKIHGRDDPETATALGNLAMVLREGGKLPEAEKTARDAVAMFQKVLDPLHPEIARSMIELATTLTWEGKLEEAETKCRDALAILRKRYGSEDRYVAYAISELGNIMAAQGKMDEAAELQEEALAVRRKVLPRNHPEIVRSLSSLAQLHFMLGHLEESEHVTREALEITLQVASKGNSDLVQIYQHLGRVIGEQKRFAEAETVLREGLRYQREIHPTDNGDTVGLLGSIGRTFGERQQFAEAERYYREAKVICDARADISPGIHGSIHSGLGGVIVAANIAATQAPDKERQDRFAEAEKLLLSAVEMMDRSTDTPPEIRLIAIRRLVRLYIAWNEAFPDPQLPTKAAAFQKKLTTSGSISPALR